MKHKLEQGHAHAGTPVPGDFPDVFLLLGGGGMTVIEASSTTHSLCIRQSVKGGCRVGEPQILERDLASRASTDNNEMGTVSKSAGVCA